MNPYFMDKTTLGFSKDLCVFSVLHCAERAFEPVSRYPKIENGALSLALEASTGRGAAGGGGCTGNAPILGGSASDWNTDGIGRPLVGRAFLTAG